MFISSLEWSSSFFHCFPVSPFIITCLLCTSTVYSFNPAMHRVRLTVWFQLYIYIIMKRFYNEPDILEITWETLWRHREHLMLAVITITWTWRKNEQEDIANESNIIPLSPPHYFFFSKKKKLIIRRWSYLWTSLIIMQGKKIWRGKWRAEKQDVNWINLQWEASNPRNTWEIYLLMSPLTKALPAFDASLKFKS